MEITGTLQRVVYFKNGYLIGTVYDDDIRGGITVKGNLHAPQLGMQYCFQGDWQAHPKYGKGFEFNSYKIVLPSEVTGIKNYLKHNCEGIGDKLSQRLVDAYGEDTLDVCKYNHDKIVHDCGIPIKIAESLSKTLQANDVWQATLIWLEQLVAHSGASQKLINRAIELYKTECQAKISENPYRLIEDIKGVGFVIADRIATHLGYAKDSEFRILAGLRHILHEAAHGNGHTYLPVQELMDKAQRLLGVSPTTIGRVGVDIIAKGQLVQIKHGFVYLPHLYEAETYIAKKLKQLLNNNSGTIVMDTQYAGLEEDQQNALIRISHSLVSILTGAPGTGKSYTIKKIIESLPYAIILLAAPTGKAAKRMTELSDHTASTIHKLLEPQKNQYGQFVFTRDEDNPINADVIILDEASMIDVTLMASFLKAVPATTKLIFVGDTDQLPSVGPGNVLKDMVASNMIPIAELTIIKRQDAGLIIENCHRIKDGENIRLAQFGDFVFYHRGTVAAIQETIVKLMKRNLHGVINLQYTDINYTDIKGIQVISPLREKTELSCKALNNKLRAVLNDNNPDIDGCKFKQDDKVIQTENNYTLNIMNGDIGYVDHVDTSTKTTFVEFEAPVRMVEIPIQDNKLELAYSITCHKFQGSESPVIIIPIHHSLGSMVVQRNWLYTAISRTKKLCILVGEYEEIPKIISRNNQQKRFTGLQSFIKTEQEEVSNGTI